MTRQTLGIVILLCLSAPPAAAKECEIPDYPNSTGGVMNLGLSWCPATIDLPVRLLALDAATAHCALATGRSSTPGQIQARRQDVQAACEGLAALDNSNCQCPPGLRSIPVPPSPTPAAAPLPPEIQLDRYLLGAEKLLAQKDHQAALDMMGKILALQKEHQLSLPEEFHFTRAELAFAAGSFKAAMDAVNEYLVKVGRDGEFYWEALDLLDDVEAALPERNRCTGQPKGSECWMALTNQPECYVWDPHFQPDATVTWTGECGEGLAQGTGTLNWVWDAGLETLEATGRLQAGQRRGQWVLHFGNGTVQEGAMVDGKKHGRWVIRSSNGTVEAGPMAEGKRNGLWVARFENGAVSKGSYVDGKLHGQWLNYKDGRVVAEAHFVDGKGKWVKK